MELKSQPVSSIFYSAFIEIDEEEGIMDLMVRPLKYKGKVIDKSGEERSSKKRRHRDKKLKERSMQKSIK